MNAASDARAEEARGKPLEAVAERLGVLDHLKRAGAEYVGPCPVCGGTDRFGLNTQKGVWQCRICGGKGDGIQLVRFVLSMTFAEAINYLVGDAIVSLDPLERARRERAAEEARLKREAAARRYRKAAMRSAKAMWDAAQPADGTMVEDYLTHRGLEFSGALPKCFRFMPEASYYLGGKDGAVIHVGPALISLMTGDGPKGPEFRGVHRTWLDLKTPSGKALIAHPDDDRPLPSKKTLGSKKGAVIRMIFGTNGRLIMGEGIETTLTPYCAGIDPDASYWAGVDLGNMAGLVRPIPGVRYSDQPNMSDADAWTPPEQIDRLTYLEDGDSNPTKTRALLLAGLRRAMNVKPGLTSEIVPAPAGKDMNDLHREGIADG